MPPVSATPAANFYTIFASVVDTSGKLPPVSTTPAANNGNNIRLQTPFKGTVSRDFLLQVFFMNQFPPSPRVSHYDRFKFFRKFAAIFASKGAPPVSTTPVAKLPPVSTTPAANFATSLASVVDTGGKFAAGNKDKNKCFYWSTILTKIVQTK